MSPHFFGVKGAASAFRKAAAAGLVLSMAIVVQTLASDLSRLPLAPEHELGRPAKDWLIQPPSEHVALFRGNDTNQLILDNGLIRRTFLLSPNAATVGLDNSTTGASLLRAVEPEALLTIDGHEYQVGGLTGQPDAAFLRPEWLTALKADSNSFQFVDFSKSNPKAPFAWKRKRHSADLAWPPSGLALDFLYRGPDERTRAVAVTVHYELYDGAPVLGKWLSITNLGADTITVNNITTEILAAVEGESAVDARATNRWRLPPILVMSDYSFGGMDPVTANRVTEWLPDPHYSTQVHYERKTPCLLVCRPPIGPGLRLEPGQGFSSFRSFLVLPDSDTRERQGLALRHAQRLLAPWSTENPIMMHVRNAASAQFRAAVDQCAEVGFEMIIYTFGSGLDMENEDPSYLEKVKADVDYAHSKGIEVGAYSLFSSRRIDDANDVINPQTMKTGGAIFGQAPCLGSVWGANYLRKLTNFIAQTGLDLLEHDGPYPGDVCASTSHPGHRGLEDSQWRQWSMNCDLYRWCRERGVYVNAPDYYFMAGSSKTGMGYREDNWSLPRAQQILHGRQNIYDGTWEKNPTMGWMFVPLTEYQGGGAAATLEPLSQHLADYEAHLANNFGAGVQACYRGPRLYDTPETRALLQRWVRWFKKYRDILESDIIHLRRADSRDLDYYLHANPSAAPCGMAVVFNPLDHEVKRSISLPLYYTGLRDRARIREQEGSSHVMRLDRDYTLRLQVHLATNSRTWFVIEHP